jgi:hypothetical protein
MGERLKELFPDAQRRRHGDNSSPQQIITNELSSWCLEIAMDKIRGEQYRSEIKDEERAGS